MVEPIEKTVILITAGDMKNEANPEMTENGFRSVASLAKHLPKTVSRVVCGLGRIHTQVAQALGLENRITELSIAAGVSVFPSIGADPTFPLAHGAEVKKGYLRCQKALIWWFSTGSLNNRTILLSAAIKLWL